jgi:hypothetical protein
MNLKVNWQMAAVIIGLLLNFGAIAYWGGNTTSKLDNLDQAVTEETIQQRVEHQEFRAQISDLQQRTTWVEAKVNGTGG